MSPRRTGARLCAIPAAAAIVTVIAAAPAQAHVSGTPSDASAGAFTVLTMSVPHGCDGSPTTKVEIQMPESVLSVTPTRNPFYDVECDHRAARRARHRCPRERGHRADVDRRLHRQHPAARGPARHLRAVLPGARRRGGDARVPDGPDLRAGRDRLGRAARGGPGPRGAGAPGADVRDPAGRGGRRPPRRRQRVRRGDLGRHPGGVRDHRGLRLERARLGRARRRRARARRRAAPP